MNTQKTGAFIKALRKEHNFTQAELAQKLSCTDKAISRWETGKGLPDADMLLSLSGIFGVSINEILLGERFSFAKTPDDVTTEAVPDSRIIEEIISHTDETIVDILKEKEEEIDSTNQSLIFLFVLCCVEVVLFLFPFKFSAYVDFETIYILLIGSFVNYILAGFIKDYCKWFFPVFVTLIWFFTDDYEYGLYFGIPCVIIMGIVSTLRHIISRAAKRSF